MINIKTKKDGEMIQFSVEYSILLILIDNNNQNAFKMFDLNQRFKWILIWKSILDTGNSSYHVNSHKKLL